MSQNWNTWHASEQVPAPNQEWSLIESFKGGGPPPAQPMMGAQPQPIFEQMRPPAQPGPVYEPRQGVATPPPHPLFEPVRPPASAQPHSEPAFFGGGPLPPEFRGPPHEAPRPPPQLNLNWMNQGNPIHGAMAGKGPGSMSAAPPYAGMPQEPGKGPPGDLISGFRGHPQPQPQGAVQVPPPLEPNYLVQYETRDPYMMPSQSNMREAQAQPQYVQQPPPDFPRASTPVRSSQLEDAMISMATNVSAFVTAATTPPRQSAPREEHRQHGRHTEVKVPVLESPQDNFEQWSRASEEFLKTYASSSASQFQLGKALKDSLPKKLRAACDLSVKLDQITPSAIIAWVKGRCDETAEERHLGLTEEWQAYQRTTTDMQQYIDGFEDLVTRRSANGLDTADKAMTIISKANLTGSQP